jgi:hypothetical protein
MTSAVFFIMAFAGLAIGFSSGPPDYMSNAPGDADCTVCHFSFALNHGIGAGVGTFEVTGPATILDIAGSTTITARFPTTNQTVHGFQMTARDGADGPFSQSWTGQWDPNTFGMTVQTAFGNSDYVNHTTAGTALTTWPLGWAPSMGLPPGPVTIYAVGNLADGDSSPTGDYIFADTHTIYQARLSTVSTWPVGTSQAITLEAPTVPGHLYAMVLTDDDQTSTSLGGPFTVPLNVFSPLALLTLDPLYSFIFQNFVGSLDGSGQANAQVNVPNDPALSTLVLHLAFATFDPLAPGLVATEVSNKATITIQ